MTSLVILPTYNEAKNVLRMIEAILAQDASVEVVIVDDASPDGTAQLVEVRMEEEPRLHLVCREGERGLGGAYLAGFHFGLAREYDHILTMDCDFSHDPKALPDFFTHQEESDLLIGSRYIPLGDIGNWPTHRRALSRFANSYTRLLLHLPIHDCTSGYRSYRREVLEQIGIDDIRSSGYSFLEEMVWRVHRQGFRIVELPIFFEDRQEGASKIKLTEILRAAVHVLALAFQTPSKTRSDLKAS